MPSLLTIFTIFLRLGCTSFGGPIAHLAYFRNEFVSKKTWLTESEYAQILTLCQTLPGPASSQVGFTIGLLKGGWLGGLLAFIAFTSPSVVMLIVFAKALTWFASELGQSIIQGLMILALVVVLQAVMSMGKQLCNTRMTFSIAGLSFVIILLSNQPVVQLIVIICAVLCALLTRINKTTDSVAAKHKYQPVEAAVHGSKTFLSNVHFGYTSTIVCASLLLLTLFGLPLLSSTSFEYADVFFQAGAMVFGGGHVVMPLLESSMVETGVIEHSQFLAGYGATQAVPGPMFAFAAYLGFLLPNEQGGMFGAILATVFIFLPGFLLIGALLPLWPKLSKNNMVMTGFVGANAAVVGLLAAALYDPIFTHAIGSAHHLAIAAIVYVGMAKWKLPVVGGVLLAVGLSIGFN